MSRLNDKLVWLILCIAISACAPIGRYYQNQDSAPKIVPKHVSTQDAIPKYEPYAPANLRPYTIRGVHYRPMSSGLGFSDTGEASWYGQKFHGHKTSNGEIYDMYQMSAAHKTLPLPSFARVTNLDNGKQVIVRINDRGPFHINRIVDLSYAAALKLDLLKTGVGNVKLDVIHVDSNGNVTEGNTSTVSQTKATKSNAGKFIQLLASKNKQRIHTLGQKATAKYHIPYRVVNIKGIYKLQLGPLKTDTNHQLLLKKLKTSDYPNAYTVFVK
ncbi:septal ring lytic transglycosylase RlpA family protein [Paraglaciecola sp.]|uniref:septal ring lytic transglycosylase RlpA family protein n=1 Tax=Paraglaciecola sp. TaxID=1920173 RepID=UPI003EF1267B